MARPSALDIIERRESAGKNVPNYKYGPGFSASGHFQMIKGTWRRWAKAVGIDTDKYPEAINAPYELQRKAAEYGFRTEGFKPWEATKHLVGQEKNYAETSGATGAAYTGAPVVQPTANANNIPGGYIPSELPPEGILSPGAPTPGSLRGAMQKAVAFQGMNETANRAALGEFMAEKGIPFTPDNVAWCARFVNASLASQGMPGTGSNLARSFLQWGQGTSTPQEGDIAVFARGGDPNKGHVGFYGGTVERDGQQFIRVFGGNQGGAAKGGGEAGWTEIPASRLLGYRTMGGTVPAPEGGTAAPAEAPSGVLGLPGTSAPDVTTTGSVGRAAATAPYSVAPNSDAARMLSDPTRYGLSPEAAVQMRAQLAAGGPGGGTIGNVPAPAPAPSPPAAPAPPAGVLSTAQPAPAPGAPPPAPGGQGAVTQLFSDWKDRKPLSIFQGGWT